MICNYTLKKERKKKTQTHALTQLNLKSILETTATYYSKMMIKNKTKKPKKNTMLFLPAHTVLYSWKVFVVGSLNHSVITIVDRRLVRTGATGVLHPWNFEIL